MRTKEKILEDAGDPRNGIKEHFTLEVLIDIRNALVDLKNNLSEFKNLYNSDLIHR